MYCLQAEVIGNVLEGNSVGAYLMYSTGLQMRGNHLISNRGPSGYGLGLKDLDGSVVEGNIIADNRVGVFMEHATAAFTGNMIGGNDVGLRVLPSAMSNTFADNTLLDNGEQVDAEPGPSMATNRWAGNYWSDYRGWDADGDGTGETPYRMARLLERMIDRYPTLRLYADSPAAQAIELAARMFPLFMPKPLLEDAAPRMRPQRPGALP
jgi:nitrous oxidase accessory protein